MMPSRHHRRPRPEIDRDLARHELPLPSERRASLPFEGVADARTVIAPWPSHRPAPGDLERLDALLEQLDPEALGSGVFWCWPNRDPEPVTGTPKGWLAAWARDRAVYRLTSNQF